MLEIWDLLDENGNVTGKTLQRGELIPEGFYHQGVDIWILNSQNQILIQKRSPMKRNAPNLWAMTGGSVVKGETNLQAIERETHEELGIQLNIENIELIGRCKTGKVWLDEYFIRQDVNLKDIVMQEEEVCDVNWVTFNEIEELIGRGEFMEHRWEFVRDFIKNKLEEK